MHLDFPPVIRRIRRLILGLTQSGFTGFFQANSVGVRLGLIKATINDGCDCDGGHEDISTTVISGCDARQSLSRPNMFSNMALFVLYFAESCGLIAPSARWDAGRDALCFQGGAILV